MPTETDTRVAKSTNSARAARRKRSATISASSPGVPGGIIANSSPPRRVGTLEPRVQRRSTSAKRRSTSSPAG
jgi:hypothetical protein